MYDHKAVIGAELEEDEELLWSAQPKQGYLLRPADTFMIPFSLIWGGFAIFWEYQAITGDAPFLFVLFGLPFVGIGLYLIAGRFYYDALLRGKTFYGITDRRVIILSGIRKKQSKSIAIKDIADLNMIENPDGSGVIALGPEDMENVSQSELVWPGQADIKPRLSDLRHVSNPYKIIQQLRQKANATVN